LVAHVFPDQPRGDPLPRKVAVGQIVAEAPGVLGKVRQRVVDLQTQQKLAVVQTRGSSFHLLAMKGCLRSAPESISNHGNTTVHKPWFIKCLFLIVPAIDTMK